MLLETTRGTIAYEERGSGNPVVMLSSGAHDRHDFDALRGLLDTGHAPKVSDPEGFASIFLSFAEGAFKSETSEQPA